MNGKDLLEAMGHVDEKYVDEAEYRTLKRRLPVGWLSVAACLCLLIGGAMFLLKPGYSNDCAAMPESNSGSNMAMDSNVAETAAGVDRYGEEATEAEYSYGEQPSVTLRIVAWNTDSITATVCDSEEDAEILPLGQEVTVLFGERIRTNREWRMPTEADFPVGSHVVVIYHSYMEENGEVSIVMEAIMEAEE